eukprot:comp20913_c0_seq3/m.27886 comp20913_c0_seq3/g.27886  ORF comp20913_c0_seq3/g.27886 comp20913_c0_seq3/m.27886 type:complete len:196 (-) comp20913_c0_seq3:3-590(-)
MDCRRDSLSKIDHTHFPNPPPPPPPPNSYNFSSFAENPVFSHYGASSLPTNGFTTRPSALSRSDSRSSRSDHGEVFMMDEGVGPNRNDLGRDSSPSEPGQDSMYEEDEVIEEEMGGQYYAASGESASSVEMESRPMAIPHYGGHNGQYDWRSGSMYEPISLPTQSAPVSIPLRPIKRAHPHGSLKRLQTAHPLPV